MQIILNQENEKTSSLKINRLRKSKINESNPIVQTALI